RSERLAGRDDRARQAYEEFLAFWNDADPSLQPLIDARREVAVLQTPRQAPSAVVPRDERGSRCRRRRATSSDVERIEPSTTLPRCAPGGHVATPTSSGRIVIAGDGDSKLGL